MVQLEEVQGYYIDQQGRYRDEETDEIWNPPEANSASDYEAKRGGIDKNYRLVLAGIVVVCIVLLGMAAVVGVRLLRGSNQQANIGPLESVPLQSQPIAQPMAPAQTPEPPEEPTQEYVHKEQVGVMVPVAEIKELQQEATTLQAQISALSQVGLPTPGAQ